jgi:hypothetical protein
MHCLAPSRGRARIKPSSSERRSSSDEAVRRVIRDADEAQPSIAQGDAFDPKETLETAGPITPHTGIVPGYGSISRPSLLQVSG